MLEKNVMMGILILNPYSQDLSHSLLFVRLVLVVKDIRLMIALTFKAMTSLDTTVALGLAGADVIILMGVLDFRGLKQRRGNAVG